MYEIECLTEAGQSVNYASCGPICPPDVDECYPNGVCNPDVEECGPDYGGDCWPETDCFPTGDDSDDKY